MDASLPPGFSASPPAPAAPELPQGFSALPPPAPPEGFSYENPANPTEEVPTQKTNLEVPGFWSSVGSAFGRGFVQNVSDAAAGGRVILPEGVGGKSLEQQAQEAQNAPSTQDEIDTLLKRGVFDGWSDPKWWGAHIAHGMGGAAPGIGTGALAGAAIGGPVGAAVGGAVGFGFESGLSTLVPAYKAGRAAGLDPEAATHRALVDTGIATTAGTAMGLVPGVSIFGRAGADAAGDVVAGALKRPVMEALTQIGLVQPLIGDAQHLTTSLTHGEIPGTEDLLTIHVDQMAMGGVMVGGHAVLRHSYPKIPEAPPAAPEVVAESFKNQEPKLPEGFTATPPPAASPPETAQPPALSNLEETLYPRESRIFFSPTREAIEKRLPESASVEQVIATLKNSPGVKEEELLDLNLPNYLASVDGKVNKKDLLAHVEANSLILEEAQGRQPRTAQDYTDALNKDLRTPEYPNQVLPGEHSNYREFVLKTPERGPQIENEFKGASISETRLDETKNYISSHWPDDVNPIAHIRVTDRSDRNGRNLLHVEEIQSDLHQEGRKIGYRDPNAPQLADIEREVRDSNRELKNIQDAARARGLTEHQTLDTPESIDWYNRRRPLAARHREALLNNDRLPNLPFKSSWQELAVKRILRLAADEGYDGVSWSNGDQVGLRLGTAEQLRGARESYDKIIPSLFKKWAKKLGAAIGETKIDPGPLDLNPIHAVRLHKMGMDFGHINERNGFVEVNPAAGERIRMGLPLYDKGVEGKHTLSDAVKKGFPKELVEPAKKIVKAIDQLGKDMKLSREIIFDVGPKRASWRGKVDGSFQDGKYVMHINTRLLRTAEDLYATMGHELGHIIHRDKFEHATKEVKAQVFEAFRKFKSEVSDRQTTVGDVRAARDNAVSEMNDARNERLKSGGVLNDLALSDLMPKSRSYFLSFQEWFAEQTAKWATTSEKPLSRLDKFFADVGQTVRRLVEKFNSLRGRPATAEKAMQEWLDSLVEDRKESYASDIKDAFDFDTKRINQEALDRDGTPEVGATPAGASTTGGRNIINNLPPDAKGAGNASAAHADRMNRFFEWMLSLPQIAELNKHIRGLTMYKEIVSLMNLEKNNIMGAAWETLRSWKAIRDPKQQIGLGKFIDDYMNGFFKDPSDTSGTVRRPTQKEFSDLAVKHKLSAQSLKVFDKLVRDFDGTLENYRQLLLGDAARIKDPQAQMLKIEAINKQVDNLLKRPYFPAMRFGKYTITVYDSAGNVRHFEQTESLRKQRKIAEALGKSSDLLPGDRVRVGEVAKDAAPLLGMPPGLLDLMADKLELSTTQRGMLDQLRFDYAPSQSFRHQFKTKDLTPGYSTDFQRAYANFFFHGANHITRVKWVDALRDQIREVKSSSVEMNQAVKRDQIANYMTQHLSMLVDPKPDFAALRGLMFHWYLGFNPASATLNLSQTALMTFPHLASKFGGLGIGDARATAALLRASSDINNFYKKGTLIEAAKNAPPGGQGSKARALAEAVKEGVISETQAHTLAAVSEDRNLLKAFGSKAEERWQNFSEASSWMFEMTEQYNRRVAFHAAWDLAMRDPNNKYVSETVRDNPLQYKRLIDSGWTHQEAAAFTAAKHTTEATQFVYAPYSRPKFMWGRKGALFIFKSFTQNTLFNLYNNPAGAARTLLILGAVGGLMGLPGMEDINGLLKSLAWRIFGKDFDLEDEARKFAVDVLHGAIGPDMLLHGMSTKGFGIPGVLNALGSQVGLPKLFPTLDRHGSIGMGNLLPFEPGKLFGPAKDVKTNELAQLQRSSGAGFSLGFALYNFLTSQNSISDLKRWEGIMPRAASNVSHAFRYFREGKERNAAGNSVVRFDPNDTEQMSEILARAAGYQPRRLIAAYEKIQAQQEAATYWDLRKGILLKQFATALRGQNPEEKASVLQSIRNYNQELPSEAKAKSITTQVLKESVMARARTSAKQEAGLPTAKQNYQLFKNMDKYYPEGRPTGLTNVTPVK